MEVPCSMLLHPRRHRRSEDNQQAVFQLVSLISHRWINYSCPYALNNLGWNGTALSWHSKTYTIDVSRTVTILGLVFLPITCPPFHTVESYNGMRDVGGQPYVNNQPTTLEYLHTPHLLRICSFSRETGRSRRPTTWETTNVFQSIELNE